MGGKAGRSGPKKGNLNGIKNGGSLSRRRLVVGELPKPLLGVRREGRVYRRALEADVLRVKGEIDVTAAHHIDTASAATIAAGIGRWLLRTKLGEMSTADVLACSREITRSKQARDAAVKALELNAPPESIDLKTYLVNGTNGHGGNGDARTSSQATGAAP